MSALPGPFEERSSAVTVGTFDGVHRGHQQVLDELLHVARKRNERSVLVTFDPHPLRIVRPAAAPQLLTTRAEKEAIIASFGIDVVAFVPFTAELAQYEPQRFVEEILIGQFGLAHLVIGYDHGFGRGRSGDVDTLKRIGAQLGFDVDVVEPFQADGENVSSSKIRARLEQGDVRGAGQALGRPYALSGIVVRGDGRGRELGMPTANLAVAAPEKLIPRAGIYAVRADGQPAVMHIGPRPTIPDATASLEVHVFDTYENYYGRELRVEFVERIRDVVAFESMAALSAAMARDAAEARRILAAVE